MPNGKPAKIPINAINGGRAKSNDPNTWTTFENALNAFKRNTSYAGIGYVFLESDPYTGIDLDDCLDEQGEFIWGKVIVDRIDSYCEVSPSGNGVKMIIEGVKQAMVTECVSKGHGPDGIGKVEVYNHTRFFALTGHRIADVPEGIMSRQEQLDALCAELWPDKPKKALEPKPAVEEGKPSKNFDEAMLNGMRTCLTEIDKMKVADKGDGSNRLFAACCRCVEHDLPDDAALA
jgi:putative DNA primase/helicase